MNPQPSRLPDTAALAPVALFAYARPDHLARTLAALRADPLAPRTALHVFCDAPRNPAAQADCAAVRALVRDLGGFASVQVVERPVNFGLARSIVEGVTAMLQAHDQVIVLEDDLEVSPHFLRYMNEALHLYAQDPAVAAIHGYLLPLRHPVPESFFLKGADCWGWATWARAWQWFNPDGEALLRQLRERSLTKEFDLGGRYPYTRMLSHQVQGRNQSWAIRWQASVFLRGMVTLYPGRSLVRNIGHDGSGTHSTANPDFDVSLSPGPVLLHRQQAIESASGLAAVRAYHLRTRRSPRKLARYLQRRLWQLLPAASPKDRNPVIKRLAKLFAESVFGLEARVAARWASGAHWRLKAAQWAIAPAPSHFDHHTDLHHQWLRSRDPMWVERGVLSGLAMRGGRLLELSCGDGFNTRNFYSIRMDTVVACDIDPTAIATARRKNPAPNIDYRIADIRTQMPDGAYDNVVWDFGFPLLRYFTPDEVEQVFGQVRARLGAQGVFSGYTIAQEPGDGTLCFSDTERLRAYMARFFAHVTVFETRSHDRHNLYFWASQSTVPLRPDWPQVAIC
jgi:hypothetical protein